MITRALAGRPWVRRHPFATGILVIAAAIFGLMLAVPGDEGRGILLVGISAFALPIVAVVWLVTWLIDRRKTSRGDEAAADASTSPAGIWPPSAQPVTPRDVASLFRNPSPAPTNPSTEFRDASPPLTTPPADPTADPTTYRPITLDAIVEMTPTEFEQLCVRLLFGLGYTVLERTGGADDLGTVVGRDPRGRSVVVQINRYAGDTLGSDTIQAFAATSTAVPQTERRILIATADVSRPAIRLALEHGILLIDGEDLVKLLDLTGCY